MSYSPSCHGCRGNQGRQSRPRKVKHGTNVTKTIHLIYGVCVLILRLAIIWSVKCVLIVCLGRVQIGRNRLYYSARLDLKLPNKRHQNKRLGRMRTHRIRNGYSAVAFFSRLNNVLWNYTLRPAALYTKQKGGMR